MDSTIRTPVGRFQEGILGITDLRWTWMHIFIFALATRALVATVLLPLLASVLQMVLSIQGVYALSDQEILSFALSPMGGATLVLLGGLWIGVRFIEQAGMMLIGFGASVGRRVTWLHALRFVIRKLRLILPLGIHLLVRVLLLAFPFLALSGGVFWILLRHYDINYYLAERPLEFHLAAGIIGVLLAVLAVLLVRKIASWLFALSGVLFGGLQPAAAIRRSVADSRGHLWELSVWLLAWLLTGMAVAAVATWTIGFAGRILLLAMLNSLKLTALTIAGVGLVTLLANFLVSLCAAALLALVSAQLYREYSGPGELDGRCFSPVPLEESTGKRIPAKRLLGCCAVALAVAVVGATLIASKLVIDEKPLVIAHRGASSVAPENTMAAVQRAIGNRADYVEIDVQETGDGEVVVFHDSDFMKIAGNPLKIWDATRADLDEIDIGTSFDSGFAAERVPTLDEVLRECKGRIKVVIELKYYGHDKNLEQRVIDIVERHDMAKDISMMSLKYDKVAKTKALRPDWNYGLLTSVQLGDMSHFDVNFLAINVGGANHAFIRNARSSGRDLYVWTVNDALVMSSMMGRGVNGIITDKPALAFRVREIRTDMNPMERLLITVGTEVGILSLPEEVYREDDA